MTEIFKRLLAGAIRLVMSGRHPFSSRFFQGVGRMVEDHTIGGIGTSCFDQHIGEHGNNRSLGVRNNINGIEFCCRFSSNHQN